MADHKNGDEAGGEAAATPAGVSQDGAESARLAESELPAVESPPLSPDADMPSVAPEVIIPKADEPIAAADPIAIPAKFRLRPRHRRHALLAASAAIAASLGVLVGALAAGGFSAKPVVDVASVEERKALKQSLEQLGKQVAGLKTELANANKAVNSKVAKLSGRIESVAATPTAPAPVVAAVQTQPAAYDITGSIPVQKPAVDVPLPRPAPGLASVETRPVVVPDWSIRYSRGGFVYVEGYGELYEVVPGAPLPGLGRVRSIRREHGRWVVETPRGIIVARRDRRFFE